jgi:hypothetical protein
LYLFCNIRNRQAWKIGQTKPEGFGTRKVQHEGNHNVDQDSVMTWNDVPYYDDVEKIIHWTLDDFRYRCDDGNHIGLKFTDGNHKETEWFHGLGTFFIQEIIKQVDLAKSIK